MSGSITDVGSATDTLSATVTAPQSLTDAGTGSDSATASAATAGSASDAGSGTDAGSATAAAGVGVRDTGTGSDAPSVIVSLPVAQATATSGTLPVNTATHGAGVARFRSGASGGIIPSDRSSVLDASGALSGEWRSFFTQLIAAPAPVSNVVIGASPAVFSANVRGTMMIGNGTIISMKLTRGRMDVSLSPSLASIPMGAGDILTVYFSTKPSLVFVPA